MDNPVDGAWRAPYRRPSAPNPPWVTRPARGTGRPGREPDEPRKTEGPGRYDERPRRERSPDGPHRHDRQEECLDRPRDPLPTRVEFCPPLPAGYDDAIERGLAALGIRLPTAARAAIDGHVRLLLAWNGAINLSAVRDPVRIAVRHVVDSLTGVAVLRRRRIDRFIDLGSGGGFPGIPLAAALPADRALLVDSIAKKIRFLATVAAAVGLEERVAAEAVRAEALAGSRDRERWPAVVVRAVAPLPELIEIGLPLLEPGGILVAWKRVADDGPAGLDAELAGAARALAAVDPGGRLEVAPSIAEDAIAREPAVAELASHRLVVVERGARPIDRRWPRDPAARRRDPW